MCFDLTGVTLSPFKFIMNLKEAKILFEIYLHDDFTVSLFNPESDFCFKHFSLNSNGEQEETVKFDIKDGKSEITIPQLSLIIQRIAHI
jgi:hypothetical protein